MVVVSPMPRGLAGSKVLSTLQLGCQHARTPEGPEILGEPTSRRQGTIKLKKKNSEQKHGATADSTSAPEANVCQSSGWSPPVIGVVAHVCSGGWLLSMWRRRFSLVVDQLSVVQR